MRATITSLPLLDLLFWKNTADIYTQRQAKGLQLYRDRWKIFSQDGVDRMKFMKTGEIINLPEGKQLIQEGRHVHINLYSPQRGIYKFLDINTENLSYKPMNLEVISKIYRKVNRIQSDYAPTSIWKNAPWIFTIIVLVVLCILVYSTYMGASEFVSGVHAISDVHCNFELANSTIDTLCKAREAAQLPVI